MRWKGFSLRGCDVETLVDMDASCCAVVGYSVVSSILVIAFVGFVFVWGFGLRCGVKLVGFRLITLDALMFRF